MKKKMYIALGIIAAIALIAFAVLQHPAFGSLPKGERKERVRQSPNYRNGQFQNLEDTPVSTTEESMAKQLWNYLFNAPKNTKPKEPVKAVKTDLKNLDLSKDQFIWFGHSSYLLVIDGKKILVDPVLTLDFPANFMMSSFKGANLYKPADLPDIDLLIITHDHWDHLDYGTLKQIKGRVSQVVAPLGVGAHLEKWGWADKLTELDWHEVANIAAPAAEGIKITCLPTRHFSGRLFKRGQSLWASYMLEVGGKTVFVGGDGGYGAHFADISREFPHIDLALVEDGQYDKNWSKIHTMPDELPTVMQTLGATRYIPVHNGKFALAMHDWDEPRRNAEAAAAKDSSLHIDLPTIGEPILF